VKNIQIIKNLRQKKNYNKYYSYIVYNKILDLLDNLEKKHKKHNRNEIYEHDYTKYKNITEFTKNNSILYKYVLRQNKLEFVKNQIYNKL
jgi:hypothetical protein